MLRTKLKRVQSPSPPRHAFSVARAFVSAFSLISGVEVRKCVCEYVNVHEHVHVYVYCVHFVLFLLKKYIYILHITLKIFKLTFLRKCYQVYNINRSLHSTYIFYFVFVLLFFVSLILLCSFAQLLFAHDSIRQKQQREQ